MTINELRKKYLDFFQSKGHVIIPSAPLVPENDPTTLFTSSGMQPIVPFLLGQKHPEGVKLSDSQKCFRTVDIDEIGDNRHLTFFEMLGNWSLGDYFKSEQIPWVFEFSTELLKLDPRRLYVTVFRGDPAIGVGRDEDSVALWKTAFAAKGIDARAVDEAWINGMGDGRIFYYPASKNWWSRAGEPKDMPTGEPGGPDTELFWDFGPDHKFHENSQWKDQPCHVNCDCGRFVEIGNSVFMQYVRTSSGFEELKQRNVDYGGGLERIMMAIMDVPDIFLIDAFEPLKRFLELKSNMLYDTAHWTRAMRIIMDHIRAVTFLVGDGVIPSNKDQGYFVRRLIRRAVVLAQMNGDIKDNFCADMADLVIQSYGGAYPVLKEKELFIRQEIDEEEKKFRKTIAAGLKEVEYQFSQPETQTRGVSAKVIFDLYQSHGLPPEMTYELAQQSGYAVDRTGVQQLLKEHQDLSRAGATQKFAGGLADHSVETTRLHTANHLMLEALKRVLGRDVNQKGSNITAERLRFDFNYPQKLTPEQIRQVEEIVNQQVASDLPVHFEVMELDQAKTIGATGVFEDRYAQKVKVYKIGRPGAYYSQEICGGPHVTHTSQVGRITITKEESASAGIRRVKAVTQGGTDLQPGEEAQEAYPDHH